MFPGFPNGGFGAPYNWVPQQPIVQADRHQDQLLEQLSDHLAAAHNVTLDLRNTHGSHVAVNVVDEWIKQIGSVFDWVNAFRLPDTLPHGV